MHEVAANHHRRIGEALDASQRDPVRLRRRADQRAQRRDDFSQPRIRRVLKDGHAQQRLVLRLPHRSSLDALLERSQDGRGLLYDGVIIFPFLPPAGLVASLLLASALCAHPVADGRLSARKALVLQLLRPLLRALASSCPYLAWRQAVAFGFVSRIDDIPCNFRLAGRAHNLLRRLDDILSSQKERGSDVSD